MYIGGQETEPMCINDVVEFQSTKHRPKKSTFQWLCETFPVSQFSKLSSKVRMIMSFSFKMSKKHQKYYSQLYSVRKIYLLDGLNIDMAQETILLAAQLSKTKSSIGT